jgi:hypothetical protein
MPTFIPHLQVPKLTLPVAATAKPPTPPVPASTGDALTLDALMQRQKDLAERQQGVMQMNMGTIPQGLAGMANSLVNALAQRKTEKDLAAGRADIANAMRQMNLDTGELPPDAMATLMSRDPDLGEKLYSTAMTLRAAKAKQEHWVDLPTPEGAKEGTQWQQNTVTGEKRAVGGAGITISNPPPVAAEVAARLGMATDFLDNYEGVLKEVDAGNLTGTGYLSSIMFGRGSGGAAYRTIQSGSDALLRNLTGAGMPAAEAARYVQRYEPTLTDDAATLHSKIEHLKTDLDNVTAAVTAGRKWLPPKDATTPAPDATKPAPDATTPAPDATTPPAGGGGGGTVAYPGDMPENWPANEGWPSKQQWSALSADQQQQVIARIKEVQAGQTKAP